MITKRLKTLMAARPIRFSKYEAEQQPKNKFGILTKMFKKKSPKKIRLVKSLENRRTHRIKRVSPPRPGGKVFMVGGDRVVFPRLEGDVGSRNLPEAQYSVVYYDVPQDSDKYNQTEKNEHPELCEERNEITNDQDILLRNLRKPQNYFEVVKVEDRGTDPCDLEVPQLKEDKNTEPMIPGDSEIFSWGEKRDQLCRDLHEKDEIIKHSLEEGQLLLEDIRKVKKHLLNNEKLSDLISAHLLIKQETPGDFLHLSRTCLMELGKQFLIAQNQIEVDLKKLKLELNSEKKEKHEKEEKLKIIERKLEVLASKANQENHQEIKQLEAKIKNLENSIENGKKIMKDAEKNNKVKVGKLEGELLVQKQANVQLTKDLEEKDQLNSQLKNSVERLKTSIESSKQQIRDIQSSYKSKVVKLEAELTSKMAALCENQTLVNKQLSQALDQSSGYVTQMQEVKNENTTLQSLNKSISEKMSNMEREMGKAMERCVVAERKLSRETKEVMSLRNQVDKMEKLREEELLSVDGDTWCQIMYQQDQWILEDLQTSLHEKEKNIDALRSQGDCPLKDFEKVQKELQQRRLQFNELKGVFLDFKKKRDSLVREQREFYSKMTLMSRKTISRDRFFKNLIEECQKKTERLEELEKKATNTDKIIEEANKISEAQLKAMQMEMKYTAEKLYEFENQLRLKEMQLQDVIRVFEQEKKNKTTAEEAMHTYKILLEDSKKENAEIRSKINYLEDLEKNRTNVLRVTEELAHETQKRQDTENKLRTLEKDFLDMKKQINSKEDLTLRSNNYATQNSKELELLKKKVQETTENKKYVERILIESQRSKELLQKDHEELCNKMRRAVRVMVEAKETQESLEMKLDQRMHVIHQLQKSQVETEDRLDSLKDILHEMKETIDILHQDREDLKNKLKNHMHCKAERTLQQELNILQRDKSVAEEQNARDKEILLHRLGDNDHTIKEQHKHLRAFQEQLDNLNAQLRETSVQLASERHKHTQQLLTLQADKKKLELYIEEMQRKLANKTKPQLTYEIVPSDTPHSSPFTTSDSYDPPIRDHNKHYYRK